MPSAQPIDRRDGRGARGKGRVTQRRRGGRVSRRVACGMGRGDVRRRRGTKRARSLTEPRAPRDADRFGGDRSICALRVEGRASLLQSQVASLEPRAESRDAHP
ncbi:hypothetical protein BURPS1106B_2067 [Burkholderia pseudomallei 1106b]|uniref:Uncharacterized protein n=2 Tax=Burkholderia pseudomallei TaxID=28450 RepID=A0AAX0U8Z0_BURPE|nr:hypothetical protein BURPS1106A_A3105 [Burkholderia pseudomallei 1106a]EES20606.1 hypothetical protein BURPS1106B_2067 [Burkholderia pseudomallei 1106b]PJO65184.1 hypothetical protein CWD88_17040 [Burkholderia pseudomallei]PPF08526.1 hypothetical protein B9D88_004210 [Burkholderia pseudomallei]